MANLEFEDSDQGLDLDDPSAIDGSGDGVDRDDDSDDHNASDPSVRAKVWQSKHDKKDAQLKKLLAENEGLKAAQPIQQLFNQRPDLMAIVEKALLDGAKPKQSVLVKPEPPQKPLGYDEAEAISDPTSKSFKYKLEQGDYMQKLVDYQEKRNDLLMGEVAAKTEEVENRMRAREAEVELMGKLASKGITGESATRFIDNFSKSGKLSFDDLVKFHWLKEGKKVHGVDEDTQHVRREFEPSPLLRSGGSFSDDEGRDVDPSKAFSKSLFGGARKGTKDLFA